MQRWGLISWLQDPKDSIACRECIEAVLQSTHSPVPSARVRKPEKVAAREEAFQDISRRWGPVLKKRASLWESLRSSHGDSPAVDFAFETLGELKEVHDADDVGGLLGKAGKALEPWRHVNALAEELENWVNRFAASSDPAADSAVQVMTFQGAKGLEADVVCVVGLEEGTMPRSGSEGESLAEQSRLFYVSMTRAKSELHLFHARSRSGAVSFQQLHQPGGAHTLNPSRFLAAIGKEHVEKKRHAPKR